MGANICRANFSNADLRYAQMRRVSAHAALFHDAILYCANLRDGDFQGAQFTRADLTGADLTFSNLSAANLAEAQSADAMLIRADLHQAALTDTNLASFAGVTLGTVLHPDRPSELVQPSPGRIARLAPHGILGSVAISFASSLPSDPGTSIRRLIPLILSWCWLIHRSHSPGSHGSLRRIIERARR